MEGRNNNNRFHLNSNIDGSTLSYRSYPTTPSTFPNPIPNQGNQQQPQNIQHQSYQTGVAPSGYFMNNHHPQPHNQNPQSPGYRQTQQSHLNTYQQRPTQNHVTDTTNGLVHQLSHQNLRGRSNQQINTQASSPRPRTAGGSAQTGYGNYLNAPMPNSPQQQKLPEFRPVPERNPDKYGPIAQTNQKKCSQLAEAFFKDSVKRARDRNVRQCEMEQRLSDPNTSQTRREQIWSNAGRQEGRYLRFLRTKDTPDNYQTIKIIGKGAFGEVKLVQKKQDGKVYAMKSLIKSEMFKKDQLAHVRAERDILAESDSPWVVKLYNTFQDQDFLYMLMEFLPGGDLMTMLIKYEIFSEDITRFYIAEIVLAIEAVHKYGFIHRLTATFSDIKPDNILLDRGGHVKLTDFGLSTGFHKLHDNSYYQTLLQKKSSRPANRNSVNLDQINLTVSNRSVINDWRKSRRTMAYSTVGTPDYIAPEIFSGQGYGQDCDWWSLGTIMFECQIGWPPFCAEDSHDTYRKIVNWRHTLYFPVDVQLGPEAENLIRSLVCNTENRLGRSSADEIKAHKFFRGVDFDSLRRIRAPFEPKLTSNVDTTYFPIDEIDQTDNATQLKAAAAANGNQPRVDQPELSLPFIGYTFKRFDDFNRSRY
ncbi:Serine/threonine-protein kinase cot-1 [Golovinomyces cichoracearum]|uniref:non-specific serine/threonine protein kinase n=1 Tax=Golovinomyces cichoracearum TaxID=62708 RepID=A0A420J366_9PEZI|nr:Serine/threonine-protein kinase cot-1 [Golovinomyces cichoracearum]